MDQKKILLIAGSQYGYNTSSYNYTKYLKEFYEVTYLGYDLAQPKIDTPGVNVIYISSGGSLFVRTFRFLRAILREINQNYDLIIFKYFKWNFIMRFMCRHTHAILDIRTGSVSSDRFRRNRDNALIRFNAFFFKNVSVISVALAELLRIPLTKRIIIPVGADVISDTDKSFEKLNLVYVGTLANRRIEDTITGFEKFYHEFAGKIEMHYTIVGDGPGGEKEMLKKMVTEKGLTHVINICGFIHHTKLHDLFDKSNAGVVYVPCTTYFDCQPSTKLFEYLLSGIPVIATQTTENKNVINDLNGVLIQDTPVAFYNGLKQLWRQKSQFHSPALRESVKSYTWENIIVNHLKPNLENVMNQ